MDPLSDILSLLKPNSYGFRGLDAGGDWSLGFAADDGIKCYAITSGACWLAVEDCPQPWLLNAGSFVLLSGGQAFRLYSTPAATPIDAFGFFPTFPAGEIAVLNGGGACQGVGGYFDFEGMHADLLLGMLPPVVYIGAEQGRQDLRWSIERLMRELRFPQPGGALLGEHLTQALLIEALRIHLTDRSRQDAGWLFALADRQIHAVMTAMHGDLARKWTLEELARVAGMSRSTFAVRFKETVGEPAMDYLTRWRMMVAADRLANAGMSIAVVAPTVGYESESAFGTAFKRVIGFSPRQFARGAAR
jgi:AraC-like DNA-binding protein